MAVWRRRPVSEVMVHSDQGSQFASYDWQDFLTEHGLVPSMSRRGNCHDNAVAESFFQLLKRERIRRKIYTTREEARQDVFDYIEMFYNPKSAATATTTGSRRWNSSGGTSTRSRVSREVGAIQSALRNRLASQLCTSEPERGDPGRDDDP